MFTDSEKYLLNKLLYKVKYSELDVCELNEFANSPITNEILKKLETPERIERVKEFERSHPNVKKFCFEFDNYVGVAIQKRLRNLDESVFPVIANWSDSETEKFALDILGPISFEKNQLENLKTFIKSLPKK